MYCKTRVCSRVKNASRLARHLMYKSKSLSFIIYNLILQITTFQTVAYAFIDEFDWLKNKKAWFTAAICFFEFVCGIPCVTKVRKCHLNKGRIYTRRPPAFRFWYIHVFLWYQNNIDAAFKPAAPPRFGSNIFFKYGFDLSFSRFKSLRNLY